MYKKLVFPGLLACLLVVSLVSVSCKSSDDDSGGGGETFPAAKGKLTITGLGDYNDKYIWLSGTVGSSTALYGLTDITGYPSDIAYKMVKISGGKAEVPLYKLNTSATSYSDYFIAYEGNDFFTSLFIVIISDNDGSLTQTETSALNSPVASKSLSSGTFSSGNLTVAW